MTLAQKRNSYKLQKLSLNPHKVSRNSQIVKNGKNHISMRPMKKYFEYLFLKLSFLTGKITKKKIFPSRPKTIFSNYRSLLSTLYIYFFKIRHLKIFLKTLLFVWLLGKTTQKQIPTFLLKLLAVFASLFYNNRCQNCFGTSFCYFLFLSRNILTEKLKFTRVYLKNSKKNLANLLNFYFKKKFWI
jgi:hypothetical protein